MLEEIRWAVTHVLRSPARLRFLMADGLRLPYRLIAFLRGVVPLAAEQLVAIEAAARAIPDEGLRREALASARKKAYHVAGGSILATFLPRPLAERYVSIVAPLETIYDYLDNLCDRHPDVPAQAYPVLHQAIADALHPGAPLRDYYAAGPMNGGLPANDGGYLHWLVQSVQDGTRNVGGYELLVPMFAEAARLYGEMQTFKHLPPGEREAACIAWYERHAYRDITWYEFACAAGSQFQVYVPLFMLFTRSGSSMRRRSGEPEAVDAKTIRLTYDAYFPAVAALHVLLDAFIDQAEDREHGELNLAECYPSFNEMRQRVKVLAGRASSAFAHLPDPFPHRFLMRVMALFYLTHPKVFAQGLETQALQLLASF